MATTQRSAVESKTLTRAERRRLATRARLVAAARSVIAEKGIDTATILDITEAADVGFGTFYNHFDSKEAVLEEVILEILEAFHRRLDRITEPLEDPAEVVAAVVANTIRLVEVDPVFCRFLIRVGSVRKQLGDGLGWRMKRDLVEGMRSGRFQIPNLRACRISLGGVLFLAVTERLRGRLSPQEDRHVAHLVLRLLGVAEEESAAIARRAVKNAESRVGSLEPGGEPIS